MIPTVFLQRVSATLILATAFLSPASFAQEGAPLQLDVRVRVKNNHNKHPVSFQRQVGENGEATVSGTVFNLPGEETALVALKFDYRIDADIALDEIISRIVITIQDATGRRFSTATIKPDMIPLNPNRAPLYYSATLYTPNPTGGKKFYFTRVQVFGNYE